MASRDSINLGDALLLDGGSDNVVLHATFTDGTKAIFGRRHELHSAHRL